MIGLLGGLGVGAAIHYYRELASAHDRLGRTMNLVMAHASVTRVAEYAAHGDRMGLAAYLCRFVEQLKAAGATFAVLPALTPHLGISELQAMAPISVMDLTQLVADHIRAHQLTTVALFGTRYVVESNMFGRVANAIRPRAAEVDFIHKAYSTLAQTGVASGEDRQQFIRLAQTLQERDVFPHVDCTRVHVDAIMAAAR